MSSKCDSDSVGQFVYGLWGGPQSQRWSEKTLEDMKHGLPLARRLEACIYTAGAESTQALRDAAQACEYNKFFTAKVQAIAEVDRLWLNKLRIIRSAMLHWGKPIVWLDWDATLLVPELPADFWQRLHAKAPLQAKLRQYKRRKCHWRDNHQRSLCGGAFIYCREVKLIDAAIKAMEDNPTWDDEIAIAWVLDQQSNGWKGLEHWHKNYDPDWYTTSGEIYPPYKAVFTAK